MTIVLLATASGCLSFQILVPPHPSYTSCWNNISLRMSCLHFVVEDSIDLCERSTLKLRDVKVGPNRAHRTKATEYETDFALFAVLVSPCQTKLTWEEHTFKFPSSGLIMYPMTMLKTVPKTAWQAVARPIVFARSAGVEVSPRIANAKGPIVAW